MIGSNFFSTAKAAGKEVIGTYNMGASDEFVRFDIRLQRLRSVVPALGPGDIVYLLAAYSNPSWFFDNQAESRQLNLIATEHLIDEVIDAGAQLIFTATVVFFLCRK